MWITVRTPDFVHSIHAAHVEAFAPARTETNFWTLPYFRIEAPPNYQTRFLYPSRFLTRMMSDEGSTWCRDIPEAIAALRVATALI